MGKVVLPIMAAPSIPWTVQTPSGLSSMCFLESSKPDNWSNQFPPASRIAPTRDTPGITGGATCQ